VKAFVKAVGVQGGGEALAGLAYHRERHLIIGLLLHDLVVQNKLVLILQNADLHAQLHGHAGLAFADPLGVGLKDREDFLPMGDDHTQNDAPADLIDLAIRVGHETFDFQLAGYSQGRDCKLRLNQGQRLASLVQIGLGQLQVLLMRQGDEGVVFKHQLGGFGFATFFVLRRAHETFDLAQVVRLLAPVTAPHLVTPTGDEGNDLAHGVTQQVDVGGKVHAGFKDKGVAPPTQGFVGLFLPNHAGADDELVDLIEQLRGQQADVVFEGLKVVAHLREGAMAQHLADGVVLVGQLVQAVKVAVQIQLDDAINQNCPQRHAGASGGRCDLTLQQLKDGSAQRHVDIDELQALQYFGDIVAGFIIEADLGDVDFTDGHLLALDDAHGDLHLSTQHHFGATSFNV
jgi:hypothetical protein